MKRERENNKATEMKDGLKKQWMENNSLQCAEIEQRLKTCQDKDKPPLLNCHFTAILSENKWQSWQVSAALKETEAYFIHTRIFYGFYSKDRNLLLSAEFLSLTLNYWHLHHVVGEREARDGERGGAQRKEVWKIQGGSSKCSQNRVLPFLWLLFEKSSVS